MTGMSVLFVFTGTFSGEILDFDQKYGIVVMMLYKNLWTSKMLRLLLPEKYMLLVYD